LKIRGDNYPDIAGNAQYPAHQFRADMIYVGHIVTGDYQQAIDVLVKSSDLPVWGLRYLIASYAQLGMFEQAKEPIKKLLKQSPGFTISGFAAKIEFREDSDKQHFLDGLKKSGLPE
jgi:adenylate cyclase